MRITQKSSVSEMTMRREKLLGKDEPEEEEVDVKKNKDIIDVSNLEINGVKTVSKKLFEEIVDARLSEIFDYVIKQVEASSNEAKLPAGVVITGGSALIPGITKIATKIFGIPARVGYPKGMAGLVDEISSPSYSVVQGLIMYGVKNDAIKNIRGQKTAKQGSGEGVVGKIKGFFKNLMP
jgi:cell division protein FtsA